MRPQRLELAGFAAFRDPVVVDFDDADYFALVGPTGAGKSSVLDAICLALYGSVPRYDKAEIAPVVSLGANEARVALDFTVGDEQYVVVRVLRRGKADSKDVKTREVRVERRLPDGTTEVLAGAKKEADAVVPQVIGLGYDHFCKCVLLPQGQFAQFLHDGPTERQALLRELLDLGVYRRIQQVAGSRAKEAADRAQLYGEELAKLPDSSPEAIAAARARVVAVEALDADVSAAHDEFAVRAAAGTAARVAAEQATRVVEALDRVAMPSGALDVIGELAGAQQRVTLCEQALVAAERACERSERALADAPDLGGLERALHAHDELATARAALEATAADVEAIVVSAREAADRLAIAIEAHETAQQAVRERELDHAPHALAAKLRVGDPCPVCEQVVHELPQTVRDQGALESAKQTEGSAKHLRSDAERAAQQAASALATLEATRAARADRVRECEAAVVDHADRDALVAAIEHVRALVVVRDEARTEEKAVQHRRRQAQQELTAVQERARAHGEAYGAQRDALIGAGLSVPPTRGDLADDWPALVAFAADARPEQEKARDAAAEELARLLAEDRAALGGLVERARPLGIEAARIGDLVKAVAVAHTKATHELEQLEATARRRAEYEEQIRELRSRGEVASELHRLLRVDRFEAWLLEEAMDALLDGGSEMLRRLSSGAYSLARDDRDLMVVDHRNADELRSVRTLSGGETFQASLALALALADHIASLDRGGAAKLESLFLDEGFGSLDPETLDVVASTVETLADGDRMVGLVTHVRELAERVPVRFEVRKQGRTSVVERIDR